MQFKFLTCIQIPNLKVLFISIANCSRLTKVTTYSTRGTFKSLFQYPVNSQHHLLSEFLDVKKNVKRNNTKLFSHFCRVNNDRALKTKKLLDRMLKACKLFETVCNEKTIVNHLIRRLQDCSLSGNTSPPTTNDTFWCLPCKYRTRKIY